MNLFCFFFLQLQNFVGAIIFILLKCINFPYIKWTGNLNQVLEFLCLLLKSFLWSLQCVFLYKSVKIFNWFSPIILSWWRISTWIVPIRHLNLKALVEWFYYFFFLVVSCLYIFFIWDSFMLLNNFKTLPCIPIMAHTCIIQCKYTDCYICTDKCITAFFVSHMIIKDLICSATFVEGCMYSCRI